MSNHIYS